MIFRFQENLAPNDSSQITKKNLVLFSVAQPIINHHKGQKKKFSRSKKKELKKPVTWILSLHNELWISLLWNLMRHSLLFVWLLYTVVESLCCHKKKCANHFNGKNGLMCLCRNLNHQYEKKNHNALFGYRSWRVLPIQPNLADCSSVLNLSLKRASCFFSNIGDLGFYKFLSVKLLAHFFDVNTGSQQQWHWCAVL